MFGFFLEVRRTLLFFDSDACRSGHTIHSEGFVLVTLVQNPGKLDVWQKEAYKTLEIRSDWTRLDQIGSNDLKMAWGWL